MTDHDLVMQDALRKIDVEDTARLVIMYMSAEERQSLNGFHIFKSRMRREGYILYPVEICTLWSRYVGFVIPPSHSVETGRKIW